MLRATKHSLRVYTGPQKTYSLVLMQCRLLSDLKDEMWRRIDRVGLKRREDFDTLVNTPKAARYVADFVIKAGLLGQFQAVVPLQEELE